MSFNGKFLIRAKIIIANNTLKQIPNQIMANGTTYTLHKN